MIRGNPGRARAPGGTFAAPAAAVEEQEMAENNVVKLRLSLMGRPVRNYTFDKAVITIGRDPGADVFVDNPGVSRDHFRLERTPTGEYQVVDLGSANGTFVNDQMVNTAKIRSNDVVRFGKYTLWVGFEQDRRAAAAETRRAAAAADTAQHTVILSRSELGNLLEVAREKEHAAPEPAPAPTPAAGAAAPTAPAPAARTRRGSWAAPLFIGFLLGMAAGAGGMWVYVHQLAH